MLGLLDPRNACGQQILALVARGNAIIAELFRLSQQIPNVLFINSNGSVHIDIPPGLIVGPRSSGGHDPLSTSSGAGGQVADRFATRYREILFDFSYFKSQDAIEKRIETNQSLQEADEEFRENYLPMLEKFYLAFEAIHKYSLDLNRLVEELEDGHFLQESLESVLLDTDGKQLACEAVYLMGVMLLVVDERFDSLVRERILVAYYRYSAQRSATSESNVDDVCNLLRGTGLSTLTLIGVAKRPAGYPEDYFRRAGLNQQLISLVIGRLRSDDIYNQLTSYPFPEHRSTALASQASMLYIVLYFSPETLHNQPAAMREIVDKFFPDNWIISVYMGRTVNLNAAWEPYRAARTALKNTIELPLVRQIASKHFSQLKTKLVPQVENLLREGSLTEETVLENTSKLVNTIRQCNVTLRWLILHSIASDPAGSPKSRQLRDATLQEQSGGAQRATSEVLRLLLLTAELELKVREVYKNILSDRQNKLATYQSETTERMRELAQVFTGDKPSLMVKVEKNSSLETWFQKMANEMSQLDLTQPEMVSRKLVELINANQEVEELHHVISTPQVKTFMEETRHRIVLMLKTLNIKESTLVTFQVIGDLSYAWEQMDSCFTNEMRAGVKEDPSLVLRLRSTFLKLSSALDMPLLRLNQANSPDLMGVSRFYSSELVAYVRTVLHVIPETLFSLMARIIELQTVSIRELPTRLMKDQLRSYAQLDERMEVAKLTHSIAVFTEGILAMKTTLVGIIQIDAARLLEDGIRRELVKQVANALHSVLVFNPKSKSNSSLPDGTELKTKLATLSSLMSGFKRSFEYIQDYVCIYGLRIWQEEVSRIVRYNVEQECNAFLRNKILDWESVYQSRTVPIPNFPPLDGNSVNFIGRLAREILRVTSPARTIYVDQTSAWYDSKSPRTGDPIVDRKLFDILLMSSIDAAGLNGVDQLFSFMIASQLSDLVQLINKELSSERNLQENLVQLQEFLSDLREPSSLSSCKVYGTLLSRGAKLWTNVWDALLKIGQMQILRSRIAFALSARCKFQSRHLADCLSNFNDAVLATLNSPRGAALMRNDSPLLYELGQYLEYAGMTNPLEKIYTTERSPNQVELITWLTVSSNISKLHYVRAVGGLTGRRPADAADGYPLLMGCLTLLRQWPNFGLLVKFTHLICIQTSYLMQQQTPPGSSSKALSDLPQDIVTWLAFLEEWRSHSTKGQTADIPLADFLVDSFHSLTLVNNSK